MRYLCTDYGEKNTGLAICDEEETIVSPLTVLSTNKELFCRIAETARKNSIQAIVVGLPFNMDGTAGKQAKKTRDFAGRLKKHLDLPIYFQDERLSSFAAADKYEAVQMSRKHKKKHLHAVAAAEILQEFLDKQKSIGN